MELVLTVLVVAALLFINEQWVRRLSQPNEFSRKFIHITVGSFVAFWPFFLSWNQIILLSAAFVVGVLVSKYFNIFEAIHSVQRPTYGELLFAVAVGAVAMVTESKGVYAAALLHMSLADGLAAIVGMRYGQKNQYQILGTTKSLAGTSTFFAVSLALLIGYAVLAPVSIPLFYIVALAASASLIENLGAYGLDNLFVPMLVAAALGGL